MPVNLAAPDALDQQKRAIVGSEAAGTQDASRLVKMRIQQQATAAEAGRSRSREDAD